MGALSPQFAFLPPEIAKLVSLRELSEWPENLTDGFHYFVEKYNLWLAVENSDFALLERHGVGLCVLSANQLVEAEQLCSNVPNRASEPIIKSHPVV